MIHFISYDWTMVVGGCCGLRGELWGWGREGDKDGDDWGGEWLWNVIRWGCC